MKRIAFVLVAIAVLAGVVAYVASASGQADEPYFLNLTPQ